MLYTPATSPQVLVTVNDLVAVCPEFNCDYAYKNSVGEVTGQSMASNGLGLTIQGTDLPTEDVTVSLGGVDCASISIEIRVPASDEVEDEAAGAQSTVTCTLAHSPPAGSWNVEVLTGMGLVPVQAGLGPLDVAISTTGIRPSVGLNQNGGDLLTIGGTGFPTAASDAAVRFQDGTDCAVRSSTPTEITCVVAGFDQGRLDVGEPVQATVTVNAIADSVQRVRVGTVRLTANAVTPSSVSPVLKSDLTIALMSDYPETLRVEDFSAELQLASDNSVTRPLYVKSVDNSAKTVTVKFPGAPSGSYVVQLTSATLGRIDKSNLALTTEAKVTGISPTQGSLLGGTLVTIDGANFSDERLDNPVMIGDSLCIVESTSARQIVCRVEPRRQAGQESSEETVSVLLKLGETARCTGRAGGCTFTFAPPTAEVTSLTAAFDETTNTHVLTLEGSGFPSGNLGGIELFIDGFAQEPLSVSPTTATFTLANALGRRTDDIVV